MKKTVAFLLALVLALGLVGCGTQHDSIYEDDAELAASDKYSVSLYNGLSIEEGYYDFSAGTISGTRTIWRLHAQEGEAEVTLGYTLTEENGGSVKLILVSPDDTITTLAEASAAQESGTHSFEPTAGTWRLKIVGKGEAKMRAHLEYNAGEIGTD